MNQDGLEFIVPVGQSEEKAFYDAIINDVDGIMSDERKDEWLRLLVPQLIESGEMSREEKKELGFAQGGRISLYAGTPEKGIKSLEAGAFPIKVKGDVRPENMKMAKSFRLMKEDMKDIRPRHKLDFMKQTGPITDWQKEILENLTEEDIEYLKEKGSPFPFNIIEKIIKAPYIIRGGEVEDWAKGGRVGKLGGGMPRIPMGMPRVNAGGIRELDYRQSGGFVPMGVKEKADDVPAMLSKNEFVMTADAVRGAGGGSVEKGAQRMYDTMKRLEGKIA